MVKYVVVGVIDDKLVLSDCVEAVIVTEQIILRGTASLTKNLHVLHWIANFQRLFD